MSASKKLTKMRGYLGKINGKARGLSDDELKMAGAAGEFLTESLLDLLGYCWIRSDQHKKRYSKALIGPAKRPDYIVADEDDVYFVEAKHVNFYDVGGKYRIYLSTDEVERLLKAKSIFKMDIFVIAWSRSADKLEFTVVCINSFMLDNQIYYVEILFSDVEPYDQHLS